MPVFSNETLLRYFNQGEVELSTEKPFLVSRTALAIVSGTSEYTLPEYVVSIRRVTYKGMKLDPLPQRNLREVFQSATQQGRPFWYIYNNVGLNKIKLFPCPNENISAVTDVWDDDIQTGCIVEYYRSSDNDTFIIPEQLRRQLLKLYVAKQCFSMEGAGQNIKMAEYFNKRWEQQKQEFISLIDELYIKPRKLVTNEVVTSNFYPAAPVLPIANFGTSVDDGY